MANATRKCCTKLCLVTRSSCLVDCDSTYPILFTLHMINGILSVVSASIQCVEARYLSACGPAQVEEEEEEEEEEGEGGEVVVVDLAQHKKERSQHVRACLYMFRSS